MRIYNFVTGKAITFGGFTLHYWKDNDSGTPLIWFLYKGRSIFRF